MTKLVPLGMNASNGLFTIAYPGDTFTVQSSHKTYTGTTTGGSLVHYLTDNGLVGGNPLFSSISFINPRFASNDPNFGLSYTLSGVTLTITEVKQAFSGITVLGINVLGSVAISAAADGTTITTQITGVYA